MIFNRFNLDSNVHLEDLVDHLPNQVTGAQLYGLCHKAWLKSARRVIQQRGLHINGKYFAQLNIN